MRFEERQERILGRMRDEGLDAMLVTNLVNVHYACGYVGSNGVVLLTPNRRVLFTDFRYVAVATRDTLGVEVIEAGRDLLERTLEVLVAVAAGGRVGFESEHTSVARHARLVAELPGVELVPTQGLVEGVRVRKEPDEIIAMTRAGEIADQAFTACADGLFRGRTEREIAWELEAVMRRAGAQRASFEIIVASGAHGAQPHAVPSDEAILPDTLVTVDMGAMVDGYASDCTRTFATGPLPETLERAYDVCLSAQERAVAAVRPGIAGGELDAVARDHITAEGFGDAFRHGLGHGVGLEVHERPWARQGITDPIEAGMTITVEPGIYLEGVGGVRIEDLLFVTTDGAQVLTRFPKALLRVDS
jgi:Xaa-Pro aminopeptidase